MYLAVFNAGKMPHRQFWYCLSTDNKPYTSYIGDLLYVIDDQEYFVWDGSDWVEFYEVKIKIDVEYKDEEDEEEIE